MRPAVPDLHVGLPLLLMWLAIVVLIVAGYFICRQWRRRHHKVIERETSYTEKLQQRLGKSHHRAKSPTPGSKSIGARGKKDRGGR